MSNFLRQLKLIQEIEYTLKGNKNHFLSALEVVIKPSSLGLRSDIADAFASDKTELKGSVNGNCFKIKQRRKMFDPQHNFALLEACADQKGDDIFITGTMNGLPLIFKILFWIFGVIFLGILIGFFASKGFNGQYIMILPIVIQMLLMYGIPYLLMRRSITRTIYTLERELAYIALKSGELRMGE